MSKRSPFLTDEFLDALKAHYRVPTDYQLAKKLKVDVQVISNYRKKRSLPDEIMAIRIADELGLPRGYVLACVASERAAKRENDTLANTWRDMAEKLAILGIAVISLHVAMLAAPENSALDQILTPAASATQIYIMRSADSVILCLLIILLVSLCCTPKTNNNRE